MLPEPPFTHHDRPRDRGVGVQLCLHLGRMYSHTKDFHLFVSATARIQQTVFDRG